MLLSTIFALLTSYFAGNPVFFLLQQIAKHAEPGFGVDTSLTKIIAGIGYRLDLEWPTGDGSNSHSYSANASLASQNVEEDGRDTVRERRLWKDNDGDWHDAGCPEADCRANDLHIWYICERPSDTCPGGVESKECAMHGENAYDFIRECKPWKSAAKRCREKSNGYLVSVNTQAEHEFLRDRAYGDAFHIGLSMSRQFQAEPSSGEWTWEDGTVLGGFRPWGVGQPDGGPNTYPNYAFMNYWEAQDKPHHCWMEDEDRWWENLYLYIALGAIGAVVLSSFVQCIIASMYKTKCTDKRQQFPDAAANAQSPFGQGQGMDFQIQICSCCEDQGTCCHGIFCFAARAGDNYQTTQVAGFWCVICLIVGSEFIFTALDMACSILTEGGTDPNLRGWCRGLVVAAFLHKYRQQMRARLGNPNPQRFCCMDFFCMWWCYCCLAIQEGRTVDAIQGKHQECCCNLLDGLALGSQRYPELQSQMNYGQPVYVGGPVAVGQVVGAPVQAQAVIAQPVAGNPEGVVVQAVAIEPQKNG